MNWKIYIIQRNKEENDYIRNNIKIELIYFLKKLRNIILIENKIQKYNYY